MGKWVNITLNIFPIGNMKMLSQYFFYFCLIHFINLVSNRGFVHGIFGKEKK